MQSITFGGLDHYGESFQGMLPIRNLAAELYQDKSDYKDGWVMCYWGKLTGDLVIPRLTQKFRFQPGDIVIFRSSLLEHNIMPFEGERGSIVFVSQHNLMGHYEPEDNSGFYVVNSLTFH